jgi:hypothetical protein
MPTGPLHQYVLTGMSSFHCEVHCKKPVLWMSRKCSQRNCYLNREFPPILHWNNIPLAYFISYSILRMHECGNGYNTAQSAAIQRN